MLAPVAGSVNNDNLAFTGGAVALYSAFRLLETGAARWLAAALAGFVLASFAKLTGFLLIGGMLAGVFAALARRRRLRQWQVVAALAAILLAAPPYLAFLAQYGGPAPETAGQIMLLKSTAPEAYDWEQAPRMSFPLAGP